MLNVWDIYKDIIEKPFINNEAESTRQVNS